MIFLITIWQVIILILYMNNILQGHTLQFYNTSEGIRFPFLFTNLDKEVR